MSDFLIDLDELKEAMEQLKDTDMNAFVDMDEEMLASQRRCDEYIKKNAE